MTDLFFDQDGIIRGWCVRMATVVLVLTVLLALVGMVTMLRVL